MKPITQEYLDGLTFAELTELYKKTGSKLAAAELRKKCANLGTFMRDSKGAVTVFSER